jgi:hypothetical protein
MEQTPWLWLRDLAIFLVLCIVFIVVIVESLHRQKMRNCNRPITEDSETIRKERIFLVSLLAFAAVICAIGGQYLGFSPAAASLAAVIAIVIIWKTWEYVSLAGFQGLLIIIFVITLGGIVALLGYDKVGTSSAAGTGGAIGVISALSILWAEKVPGIFFTEN